MPFEQSHDGRFVLDLQRVEVYHLGIAVFPKRTVNIVNPGDTAAHTGSKVAPRGTEYQRPSARHVLAPVVAHTFHNGRRARVAYCEPLAGLSANEQMARGCSV